MRHDEEVETERGAELHALEFAAVLLLKDFATITHAAETGDLRFMFDHAGRRFRGQLLIDEQHRCLRFFTFLDRPFRLARVPVLLELCARLNAVLVSGSVQFDVDHGSLWFYHSRFVSRKEGEVVGVRHVLNESALGLDLLVESWKHFSAGLDAKDCVALATLRMGIASDRTSISRRGMRDLLTIQHGAGRSRASDRRPSLAPV